MVLFESMLTLLVIALVLLQVSRRWPVPYPAMLALAGVVVAALPWAPEIGIDPSLALALFIAPALLDAAFDFPPRHLRRYWLSLISLAAVLVLLTTAAVAWLGVAVAGLPLAAAIALGAIVAPPDAAAASAVLARFQLPRATVSVLKGESLLNDAVALLIFSAAVASVAAGSAGAPAATGAAATTPVALWLAVPGGLLLGFIIGKIQVAVSAPLAGSLGGTLSEFVSTFGAWVLAERLHLSAVLSVVALAMTVARYAPEKTAPRDRVHSYSVWDTTVFVLNVLAFLMVGLQARGIVERLPAKELWPAMAFAGAVLLVVVVVRIVWVMFYNRVLHFFSIKQGARKVPTLAQGMLTSWCGMRGLVTLATALALPQHFPQRDLIVLSALAVVLGTLVLQGLTLAPLIRLLRFARDESFDHELIAGRIALIDAGKASVENERGDAAEALRETLKADREAIDAGKHPREAAKIDDLTRRSIAAQRARLADLRRSGEMEEDVFHTLEEELDWAELAASPPSSFELVEG
ncbi:Na+/H+ antiporter [Variovorax sp. GrIS 2.14]|uniref:cation:proton antiporter n=1 Tax=Variovorax sp. GrIS 2.14 TaxID=3071709 RepID=UPI0038F7E45C